LVLGIGDVDAAVRSNVRVHNHPERILIGTIHSTKHLDFLESISP
jgi:hypothetical protein